MIDDPITCSTVEASGAGGSYRVNCQAHGITYPYAITTRVPKFASGEVCSSNIQCRSGTCKGNNVCK